MPGQFSLRLMLAATVFPAALCGVAVGFGPATGVMGGILLAVAMLFAWAGRGEPRDMLSMLTPVVLFLTLGGYTMRFFVDYQSWLLGCGLVVLAGGPFLLWRSDRVTWIVLVACVCWFAAMTLAYQVWRPRTIDQSTTTGHADDPLPFPPRRMSHVKRTRPHESPQAIPVQL